jgi:hypothetical protein
MTLLLHASNAKVRQHVRVTTTQHSDLAHRVSIPTMTLLLHASNAKVRQHVRVPTTPRSDLAHRVSIPTTARVD